MIKDIPMLSRDVINAVSVQENYEPLVNFTDIPSLFYSKDLPEHKKYVRKSLAFKLLEAQKILPQDVFFYIYMGFRSLDDQIKAWNELFLQTQMNYPNSPLAEQERLTRLKVADPRNGKYGPHQTGGAMDITLCDSHGIELKMGTNYIEFNEKTKTYPKISLDELVLKNRSTLYTALEQVGFVNYPGEWWHWSYQDKSYAAYSGLKNCNYGCVDEKIEKLTFKDFENQR